MVSLVCLALVLASSSDATDLKRFYFAQPLMGTKFGITLYARDEATAQKASKAAFARCAQLNAIMSDYLATSELMRLCAKAGGRAVKVSPELFTVLERARKVSEQSEGAFDVTVGPVVRLWRRARKSGRYPEKETLDKARRLVGWKMVHLDAKARSVRLEKAGMQLDLGGIAKGYAADEMLKVLKTHGIPRALVAAGGDLRIGDPPPGRPKWTIAIARVSRKETPRLLLLTNAAVSTSGDAEQFVVLDGKRYSHIVDPRTGVGLVGRMSATVIAPDGITADSLTKVVAILGPKKGFAVLKRYENVHGRYVRKTDEGVEVKRSPGFPPPKK